MCYFQSNLIVSNFASGSDFVSLLHHLSDTIISTQAKDHFSITIIVESGLWRIANQGRSKVTIISCKLKCQVIVLSNRVCQRAYTNNSFKIFNCNITDCSAFIFIEVFFFIINYKVTRIRDTTIEIFVLIWSCLKLILLIIRIILVILLVTRYLNFLCHANCNQGLSFSTQEPQTYTTVAFKFQLLIDFYDSNARVARVTARHVLVATEDLFCKLSV